MENVFVDFTLPVNGLSFLAVGDNDGGVVGAVDVFDAGGLVGSLNTLANADLDDPILLDLAAFSNVTRITIRDITDSFGLGYDDFTFIPIPEPGTAVLLSLGLTGLSWKGRRSLRS